MGFENSSTLKVLISAYACEPGKGSEPGVGWNLARHLAAHYEVWVLTRANNCPVIEVELAQSPVPGLHFVYHDLPPWARFWRRGQRGVQLYYYLWQLILIADGAGWIHDFYTDSALILDWYHLQKKCHELLSMVCHGRKARKAVEAQLLPLLWQGDVEGACQLLEGLRPQARNEEKLDELIGYLTRNIGLKFPTMIGGAPPASSTVRMLFVPHAPYGSTAGGMPTGHRPHHFGVSA